MHIAIIIVASIIVVVGIISKNVFSDNSAVIETSEENITPEVAGESDAQDDEAADYEYTTTPTPIPTNIPSTPTPTAPNQNTSTSIDSYIYPGASVISNSGNQLTLTSAADTDAITDWYKDKIISSGANVRSFVKTKTNNNVLNKLVGDNGEIEISVEIIKNSGDQVATIKVNIS